MTAVHGDFAPSELVIVRAPDAEGLVAALRHLERFLEQAPSTPLKDFAYTCSQMKGDAAIAFVTQSIEGLRGRLALAASRLASGATRIRDKSGTYYEASPDEGKLAFVFPGGYAF